MEVFNKLISELFNLTSLNNPKKISSYRLNKSRNRKYKLVDAEEFLDLYNKNKNLVSNAEYKISPLNSGDFGKFKIPVQPKQDYKDAEFLSINE